MIIRRTSEKSANGNEIVLMGNDAANLERYEQIGDELIKIPLTQEQVQAAYGDKCRFNYTNGAGKKTAVQTEPAKFIRLHGDKYITSVNKVAWHGKETSMFLVWDKSKVDSGAGEAYPVHISDLGKERDIEIIKAIQATKFAF